jgi:hypothetical protein
MSGIELHGSVGTQRCRERQRVTANGNSKINGNGKINSFVSGSYGCTDQADDSVANPLKHPRDATPFLLSSRRPEGPVGTYSEFTCASHARVQRRSRHALRACGMTALGGSIPTAFQKRSPRLLLPLSSA